MDVPPGTEEYHDATGGAQDWYEPNPKAARHRKRSKELSAKEDHPITTFIVETITGLFEIFEAFNQG